MALTPITGYPELERLKIFSDGKSEFNIGSWNFGLPKISLTAVGPNPTIKFHQQTGTDPLNEYGNAYPWYIQTQENKMKFQWGHYANIGSESVDTKVIYKVHDDVSGYVRVGINTGDNP